VELVRRFLFIAALLTAVLGAAAVVHAVRHPGTSPDTRGYALDFRVIYCGAEAVRLGRDPYLVEPLRTCEHQIHLEHGEPDWAVTPLPLPSYAIAAFVPLTWLPYDAAKLVWLAFLLLAVAAAAAALAAILDKPSLAVFFVLLPTVGILNFVYGEPVPLAIGALCLAAYLVERRSYGWAGIVAALAVVEPHVALPAIVALLVLVPETRLPLVVSLIAIGLFGLGTFGIARNVEYFAVALPAQAHAELLVSDQYSLSHLLYLAGVAPGVALALGSLSYVVTLVVGIVLANRLAPQVERPALYVLLPVATAMLGGSYIHIVQIAAALPAALLLAPFSWWARISVGLLVVRWDEPMRAEVLPVLLAAIGTAVVAFDREAVRERVAWFVFAPLLTLATLIALPKEPPELTHITSGTPAPTIRDDDLASLAWDWRVRLTPDWANSSLRRKVEDVPTWAALFFLFFVRAPRHNRFRVGWR